MGAFGPRYGGLCLPGEPGRAALGSPVRARSYRPGSPAIARRFYCNRSLGSSGWPGSAFRLPVRPPAPGSASGSRPFAWQPSLWQGSAFVLRPAQHKRSVWQYVSVSFLPRFAAPCALRLRFALPSLRLPASASRLPSEPPAFRPNLPPSRRPLCQPPEPSLAKRNGCGSAALRRLYFQLW